MSDRGREFTALVCVMINSMFTGTELRRGRAYHPQTQGSVESGNKHVKAILARLLAIHDGLCWPLACMFVAAIKNRQFHRTLSSNYRTSGCEFTITLMSIKLAFLLLGTSP
jgi:hypothetical protein